MAGKQIGATMVLREGNFFANIKKAQQGTENFKKKLGGATSTVKKHGKSIDELAGSVKRLAAGYLSFQGIKSFTEFSDNLLSSAARLDLVNDGLQTSAELNAMIYDAAEDSRSSYQSTADLVSRLGANAMGAFESTEELVGFAEQINKQFTISGASATAADNAVLQLSQGLAAGALRGEELNSILENAPGIARTIEKYMGLAEGTIKTAASQGLVTADVVKKAVMGAAEETDEKFSQMPITFAQVATNFKDKMQEAVTPLIQKHIPGITQTLNDSLPQVIDGIKTGCEGAAKAIGFVIDNWNWLGPIVYGVVGAIAAYNIVTGIQNGLTAICAATTGLSTGAFAGMTIAELASVAATTALGAAFTFLTSPITLIVLGIGLLIAGGVALYKNWDTVKEKAVGIWDKMKEIFGNIKEFVGGVWTSIKDGARTMVNGVISGLNVLIRGANQLQFDIPEWVPGLGGKKFGLNIPTIPMLANGGIIQRSGSVLVGEKGPEILNLNRGASVVPLDRAGTPVTTNHNTFYFTIHAGGLNDDLINEFVGKVKFALANM